MRPASAILVPCAVSLGLAFGSAAIAQTATTPTEALRGLWLTTDFPALAERLGDEIGIDLILRNEKLPPRRVEFAVSGLPEGWSYQVEGRGTTITAAYAQPDSDQRLSLRLIPPEDAEPGSYAFTVTGRTDGETLSLPIALTLIEAEAAEVTLEPKLPALRGTPNSNFDFQIKVTNDSPDDQVFNLLAGTPQGFQAVFKEQYGTQELTSIPLKAREAKDLTLSVKLPRDVPAGQYEVVAQVGSAEINASAPLLMDVTGQPDLALRGPEGRLSGEATAGSERTFRFTLTNEGTAPARDVRMTASSPNGWNVTFNPETVAAIEAGGEQEVAVAITPSERAIAGDYVVTVRGNGEGVSADASFRVTVMTSTVWGIAGLGVIGAAVLVLAVAVSRYGRR